MEVWKENTATVTIAGLDSGVKFTIHLYFLLQNVF